MSIVLYAIIGATINAGTAYWICFGIYSLGWTVRLLDKWSEMVGD